MCGSHLMMSLIAVTFIRLKIRQVSGLWFLVRLIIMMLLCCLTMTVKFICFMVQGNYVSLRAILVMWNLEG